MGAKRKKKETALSGGGAALCYVCSFRAACGAAARGDARAVSPAGNADLSRPRLAGGCY